MVVSNINCNFVARTALRSIVFSLNNWKGMQTAESDHRFTVHLPVLCILTVSSRVKWSNFNNLITPLYTLANSEDPDEMQLNAAYHLGLHCLLRLKQSSGTEIHHNWETPTCDPLKCIMDNLIHIAFICLGKSIGIQRVLCGTPCANKRGMYNVLSLHHWFIVG